MNALNSQQHSWASVYRKNMGPTRANSAISGHGKEGKLWNPKVRGRKNKDPKYCRQRTSCHAPGARVRAGHARRARVRAVCPGMRMRRVCRVAGYALGTAEGSSPCLYEQGGHFSQGARLCDQGFRGVVGLRGCQKRAFGFGTAQAECWCARLQDLSTMTNTMTLGAERGTGLGFWVPSVNPIS